MSSLSESDSVLRVVFATTALGMGVDFKNLDYIIHYGAPRSLEDYMAELAEITNRLDPEFTGNLLELLFMQTRVYIVTRNGRKSETI